MFNSLGLTPTCDTRPNKSSSNGPKIALAVPQGFGEHSASPVHPAGSPSGLLGDECTDRRLSSLEALGQCGTGWFSLETGMLMVT